MTNFLRKFRQIFALPKWAKIFLAVLSVIALLGLGFNTALQIWAKDKEFSANLVFHGLETWKTERLQEARKDGDTEFAYKVKAEFTSLKALLRSRTISHIEVVQIAWVEAINSAQIHGVESANRYISFITTQNLHDNANLTTAKSLGVLTYKIDFSPFLKTISKYYILIVLVIFIPFILYRYFYSIKQNLAPKIQSNLSLNLRQNLSKFDKFFLIFTALLCAGICVFTFWLGFPGFHIIGDTYNSIALVKNNAHPVFIAYVMQILYFIFGKHLFYLFLFNLVPFYAGIFFIIAAFYLRTRSKFTLLLLFPTFIGNIYFQNFIQYHSFALPMMCFCFYSMILFWILGREFIGKKAAKALWIGIFVLMFFAILWRHNAIFSVFPAFFVIVYLFLQNRNLSGKIFAKFYAKFIVLSAILCLFVVIFVPKILAHGESHPANHPFLHQIAGACVPSNDSSCFKNEWYYPHKNFEDIKALYEKYPTNADPFNVTWGYDDERPFKHEKLDGLKSAWIRAIFKYPLNFLKHEARFFKAMWWQEPGWLFDSKKMQEKATHPWHLSTLKDFPQNEQSVSFTPLKERIYSFLFEHKFTLNHIVGVSVGFILLVISSVLLGINLRLKRLNSTKNSENLGENSSLNSAVNSTLSENSVANLAKNPSLNSTANLAQNSSEIYSENLDENSANLSSNSTINLAKNSSLNSAVNSAQNSNEISSENSANLSKSKFCLKTLKRFLPINSSAKILKCLSTSSSAKMLLVFTFSAAFAAFFSFIFITAFIPVPIARYLTPIPPLSIMALVGFVAFLCEIFAIKRGVKA